VNFNITIPKDGSRLDVSGLELSAGRTSVIFGPNGAGKTTLIEYLSSGEGLGASGRTSYLQQRPHMFRGTAGFNLGLGLNTEATAWATQLAGRLGVATNLEQNAPSLSGGEKHRLALARVLATPADWVLLDEPMAPIDFAERPDILTLLAGVLDERSAVVVTHDINVVAALADHLVILDRGRIIDQGEASRVLGSPSVVRSAEILGKANLISGMAESTGGLCVLKAGDVHITGVGSVDGPGRALFGAEAVTLRLARSGHDLSNRNTWIGRVESISHQGRLVEVVVDIGVRIVAAVTPGALVDLGIEPGVDVGVAVKAAAITIVST
jgi:molybdate transport system ATP-binding protein